jgi:hypothetical protein
MATQFQTDLEVCSLQLTRFCTIEIQGLYDSFEKAPKLWEVATLFPVEAVGAQRRLCSTVR